MATPFFADNRGQKLAVCDPHSGLRFTLKDVAELASHGTAEFGAKQSLTSSLPVALKESSGVDQIGQSRNDPYLTEQDHPRRLLHS